MLILAKNAEIMLLRFYFKFSNKKKTHQIYPFLTSTNFKSAYSLCDNLTIKNNQTINNQHLHDILGNRSSYGQAFISVAYIQTPPPPPPPFPQEKSALRKESNVKAGTHLVKATFRTRNLRSMNVTISRQKMTS